MSNTTNLNLFKHDNPATNTNAFDVKSALNDNWDKIDEEVGDLQNQINELASGSPAGVYATLSDLTTADPDHSKIYVVSADGHWYYYANSQWNDGGAYQSASIGKHEIHKININNDLFKQDGLYYKNIALNSNSRNSFEKGFIFTGLEEKTIKIKGKILNDFSVSGNQLQVILTSMASLNDIGTNRELKIITLNTNDYTSLNEEITYDFSNYPYFRVGFRIVTGTFDIVNKNVTVYLDEFTINNDDPNIIQIYTPTNDVATYTFEYLITNSETAISLKNIDELVNYKKINDIYVSNSSELVSAINNIATSTANNKANINNIFNIVLNSGNYELYDVIDKSNLQDQTLFRRGLEIPDYVNLIGIGNVNVSLTIPSDYTGEQIRILSTINTYGENEFKNINFIANNCRYCIHDDDGGSLKNRKILFENCSFVHNDCNRTYWPYPECYGAGYTGGRKGIFKKCVFDNENYIPFYVHNSSSYYMTDKFDLSIDNCVFITDYNVSIDLHDAYGSLTGNININNSKLNSNLLTRGTNPFNIFGGGNNNFNFDNQNSSNNYIV